MSRLEAEVNCDYKFLTQAIEKRKWPLEEIEMTAGEIVGIGNRRAEAQFQSSKI